MRFQVLGPLAAVRHGRPVALGGSKQRATLGLLLLRANRVVATSDLIDALWTDTGSAPATARKILQNAVCGLRTVFADHGPELLTQPPGYLLRVDPARVDLFEFARHAEQGRAELAMGAPERAATTLRDALALWRGPALADLVADGLVWPELTAVQHARLDVLEDYFEAELANGRHHTALGELEMLVETEPLRERLCQQLMLALYRGGRQADALRVYARVRTELVERLGLEPGHTLRQLQQSILAHDPALALPTRTPGSQRELKILDGLLDYVQHRVAPHLVTVLGAPGPEMIHFNAGFADFVSGYADTVRFVRCPANSGKARAAIVGALREPDPRALVLAVDHLHNADDQLLDLVEDLTELAGTVPLLVVATAWPELLSRRPDWGGGRPHATTLSLGAWRHRTRQPRRVPLLLAAG
jgi:DNA-binding SARP family transcriptional activator